MKILWSRQSFWHPQHQNLSHDIYFVVQILSARIYERATNTATNIWKVLFKMYKLEQHSHSANDSKCYELQENISIGIVTDSMIVELHKRVEAVCDKENDN